MRRRDFIKIACGFVGGWPLAAHAQQPGKQRLIGILGSDPTVWRPWTAALIAHLRELGWTEGDTRCAHCRQPCPHRHARARWTPTDDHEL